MSNVEWWITVRPVRLAFGRKGWSAIGESSDGRVCGKVVAGDLGGVTTHFRSRSKARAIAKARAALVKYHRDAARELEEERQVTLYRWSPEDEAL